MDRQIEELKTRIPLWLPEPELAYGPGSLPANCTLPLDPNNYLETDFDRDRDVDPRVFAIFQRCVSGPGVPGDPSCAE